MKTTRSRSKIFLRIGIVLALVVVLGVLAGKFFSRPAGESTMSTVGSEVWTCSMHPQVRPPKPGKCPICSMPLVRADPSGNRTADASGESMLTLSDHARAMASVETAPIGRRKLTRDIRAVGRVQYNESALSTITARVDGYIERLFIDYTGVEVKAVDHLVEIYSPDLLIAQQEMLMNPPQSGVVEAVKLKLRRWEISEAQINEILRTRKPQERITLTSPIDGTVTEKLAVKKSAVKAGDVLYRLANLDSVWVYLDIYEYELSWVLYGQTAEITTEAFPGETFTGRVWFINPVLTDESRTVKVLVNIPQSSTFNAIQRHQRMLGKSTGSVTPTFAPLQLGPCFGGIGPRPLRPRRKSRCVLFKMNGFDCRQQSM